MEKSTRHETAVSLIIKDDEGRFLVVKRPDDPDDDLANVWGFPATTLANDESIDDAAKRVGWGKLGVTVEVGRKLGDSTHDRGSIVLHLIDFEARIVDGVPKVPQPNRSGSQYDDWRWETDPNVLLEAARKGSQCTQIFLEKMGVDWRSAADGIGETSHGREAS